MLIRYFRAMSIIDCAMMNADVNLLKPFVQKQIERLKRRMDPVKLETETFTLQVNTYCHNNISFVPHCVWRFTYSRRY